MYNQQFYDYSKHIKKIPYGIVAEIFTMRQGKKDVKNVCGSPVEKMGDSPVVTD